MPIGNMARRLRWIALLSLIIVAAVILPGWKHGASNQFTVVFLDVGQGDSAFLRTPSGKTILIDGGGRPDAPDEDSTGVRIVEPFLRSQGVNHIDLVVLSHPHDDHVQGLVPVIRDFRIGSVLDPGIPHAANSYRRFLSEIRSRHIKYRLALRGQEIDFGDGVKARVLHPPNEKLTGTGDDVNNNSDVLRFTFGKRSVLFMGDAGVAAEQVILNSGEKVRSDVIKIGHHGSAYATGDEWLDAVSPRIAVISVGRNNAFGHPAHSVLRRLCSRGIRVYRTDRDGAVTVRICNDHVYVSTFTARKRR